MKVLLALILAATCLCPQGRDLRLEPESKRLALIIGNDQYPKWPLRNSVNDAKAMTQALAAHGFQAETITNATLRSMEQAIDRFIVRVRPGDVAVFYYAGHGIQLAGENYLVPVDFDAKDEADAKYVSYSASRLHERMDDSGARLNILILDACRNNPFRATRSTTGGLAAMATGRGTLIAFATAPGKTADDNPSGRNGLFTSHLVASLKEPGLSLDQIFNRVRERVYNDSNQRQLPWTVSSVIGEFYFSDGPKPQNPLSNSSVSTSSAEVPRNPLARKQPSTESASNPLVTQQQEVPAPPPADFAAMNASATKAFERGDYDEASRLAMEIVRSSPHDKQALFTLAATRFKTQQFDQFEAVAVEALQAGVTLPFVLGHHHTLAQPHASMLKVTSSGLAFDPATTAGNCSQRAFEAPLRDVVEAIVTTTTQGEVLLRLRIRDAQNKMKTLNFADPDSKVDNSSGLPKLVSPPKAARQLQAVVNILKKAGVQ